MGTGIVKDVSFGAERPAAASERVLRLLGMTQRPLRWAELQGACGLRTHEFRLTWDWLLDNGYVAPTAPTHEASSRAVEAVWSLADKGRAWARDHDALMAHGR